MFIKETYSYISPVIGWGMEVVILLKYRVWFAKDNSYWFVSVKDILRILRNSFKLLVS